MAARLDKDCSLPNEYLDYPEYPSALKVSGNCFERRLFFPAASFSSGVSLVLQEKICYTRRLSEPSGVGISLPAWPSLLALVQAPSRYRDPASGRMQALALSAKTLYFDQREYDSGVAGGLPLLWWVLQAQIW